MFFIFGINNEEKNTDISWQAVCPICGRLSRVFLVEKIRGEMNFGSLEELKNRIFADRETALSILKGENFCEF